MKEDQNAYRQDSQLVRIKGSSMYCVKGES